MHRATDIELALVLMEAGFNDCQVARVTGIPRRTITDWRHGRIPGRRAEQRHGRAAVAIDCLRCEGRDPAPPPAAYAYVLGLYLGDGCISQMPRTYKIRITLDAAYPGIVERCATALEQIRPGKRAWQGRRRDSRCVEVAMYWNHWPCLIPQHGPGRKHRKSAVQVLDTFIGPKS
jgi:hypothetical protein